MAAPTIPPEGTLCFYAHPEHSWILGHISGTLNAKKQVPVKDKDHGGATVLVTPQEIYPVNDEGILNEDVDDLLLLSELHDSTLLNTLRRRYFQDVVYTYIGPIVIAINPFNYTIPWYRDDFMPNYLVEGPVIQKNKPHSWSVAHNTYFEMLAERENQSILVSGESGAGKTEAVKIVIKYIRGLMNQRAKDPAHRDELAAVGQRILLASPILEAFGNAKTGRNDNSSRFGKFLQLQFDSDGFLRGSFAIAYLLEKSRVITAAQGERVYHSFYQLAKGKDSAKFSITEQPRNYPSLVAGGVIDNASMEDAEGDDLSYRMTMEAFEVCGVSKDQAQSVWRGLAAVLLLLRFNFSGEEATGSTIDGGDAVIGQVAQLLSIDPEQLKTELLTTTSEVRGESYTVLHAPPLCRTIRNSLCQAVYNGIFLWLFEVINASTDAGDSSSMWMGLLDIFGFEDFKVNSFEQLCINLANETLQNHYNSYIFEKDMAECRAEGIDTAVIIFADNTVTCKLLTDKMGIFDLLDEECSLGKGTDLGFLDKVVERHASHPSFVKKTLWKTCFAVSHYAGTVKYEVENFLVKNKDIVKDQLKLLFRNSSDPVIALSLPAPIERRGGRLPTVSGHFVQQISDLMTMINSTHPHWIRCIKPHPAKKPKMLHGASSMSQMVNSGVIETVRIRQLGYPVRLNHKAFIGRFAILAKKGGGVINLADPAGSCAAILKGAEFNKTQAQLGTTKVFLKSQAYQDIEELKRAAIACHGIMVQRFARVKAAHLIFQEKIFIANKELIEALRAAIRARSELVDVEQSERVKVEREWEEGVNALWQPMSAIIADYMANREKYLRIALEKKHIGEQEGLYEEAASDLATVAVAEVADRDALALHMKRAHRAAQAAQAKREQAEYIAEQKREKARLRQESVRAAAEAQALAELKSAQRQQRRLDAAQARTAKAAAQAALHVKKVALARDAARMEQERRLNEVTVKDQRERDRVVALEHDRAADISHQASIANARHATVKERLHEKEEWKNEKMMLLQIARGSIDKTAEQRERERHMLRGVARARTDMTADILREHRKSVERMDRDATAAVIQKEALLERDRAAHQKAVEREEMRLRARQAQLVEEQEKLERMEQRATEVRRQKLLHSASHKVGSDGDAAMKMVQRKAECQQAKLRSTLSALTGSPKKVSPIDDATYEQLLGPEARDLASLRDRELLVSASKTPPSRAIETSWRPA